MDRRVRLPTSRSRLAWWGVVTLLGLVAAGFVVSFVGTFVLGLFLYYAARPLFRRINGRVERRTVAATLTMVLAVLPIVALAGYASMVAVRELAVLAGPGVVDQVLSRLNPSPEQLAVLVQFPARLLSRLERLRQLRALVTRSLTTLGVLANGLLHLTLSFSLAFFLLRDEHRLAGWFRDAIAGRDTLAWAYLEAVDDDLQTVYLGNVLTVLVVGLTAIVVYHGFNLVAPQVLTLPAPTMLALLTGLATFVPLVVGKLVYVPTAAYLLWEATRADAGLGLLPWVVGFLLVCFVVLDLLPQALVRPYVAGQSLHFELVLFSYVLGAALFGWYGLFLGPLLAVLVTRAADVVLPELLHGEKLTTDTHLGMTSDDRVGTRADPDSEDEVSDPDSGEVQTEATHDDGAADPVDDQP